MKKITLLILSSFIFSQTLFAQTGWFSQNSGISFSLYSVYCIDPISVYTVGDNFEILKSSNGGSNWAHLYSGPYPLYTSYFINVNTGWVAGSDGGIWKTVNAGVSFFQQSQITANLFNSIRFIDNNIGLAAGGNGTIVKTTDGGLTWNFQQSGVLSTLYSIYTIDENNIYISGAGGKILFTNNGGATWSNLSSGTAENLYSVYFMDMNTGFAVGGNTIGLILKTVNGGTSWVSQNSGTSNPLKSVFAASGTAIYAAGTNGVIIKTTNSGINWYSEISGTSSTLNQVFFIDNNTGYAVGNNGVILKTTDGGGLVGIKPISGDVPEEYSLFQNYPNPFNPSTKIKFSISPSHSTGEGQGVRLIIYDLLSREIATLVNEQLKPGTYEVNWDASDYSSGIYFYKLSAGEFTETKRMVIVK